MTDYRKNGSAVGGGGGMANPMTTVGDIVVGDTVSGGVAAPARLGAGASGYILRSVAGTPAWRELSAAGLGGVRPNAVATREGQTYWSTDAAAGSELAMCVHKGGTTYAWETLAYGAAYVVTASKTTTYTAAPGDIIPCNATGGAFTVNLPAAAGVVQSIRVKKTDASANAITIDGNASETIDGAATRTLTTQYEAVELWSDGAGWLVF